MEIPRVNRRFDIDKEAMSKSVLCIESGHVHLGKDKGASGNGYNEAELTFELRNLIVDHLISITAGLTITTDSDDEVLTDVVKGFNNVMDEKSISLSIHFNAASEKATGTEVIYPDRHTMEEFKWAVELSSLVAKKLNLKDRGAKPEALTFRKKLYIRTMKGHNLLLETCFISNKNDMIAYQNKKHELAKDIAQFLLDKYNSIHK